MKRIYNRSEWRARNGQDMAGQRLASVREVLIHHSDNPHAETVKTLEAQKSAMRAIQGFHMNTRGWSDIAYHAVVFQAQGNIPGARIFLARNLNNVPAAQEYHNTNTLAICVFGHFGQDTVKKNTRYAIELMIDHARKRGMTNLRTIGGHRDVVNTSCPGNHLYDALPQIARASSLRLFKS